MATTPDYTVNYEDERLTSVNDERDAALAQNSQLYGDMANSVDGFYNDLKDQHQQWADKQAQIQQEQTDFTIEKIEQQKEQAEKDYIKEQSGAYVDWQKQSNKYGAEAEKMASAGLTGSGYSESSQVSMYNTYQNRVATAREVLAQAKLNYDNGIKEAMLQNSAALAEIYATNYLKQAELALEGFQYKNQLLLEQANKELEIKNMYHNQWMDQLNQINTENALAEEVRQHNETMAWNTEQAELNRQHDIKLKEIQHNYDKALAEIEQKYKLAYLDAETAKEKEKLKVQHEYDIAKLNQQLKNEKALLDYEYTLSKSKGTAVTGSSGGSNLSKVTKNDAMKAMISPTNSKTTTTSTPKVNVSSKLTLGKGPVSDKTAAQMVNNGSAIATMKNGQVYVAPAVSLPTSKLKQNLLK